jgi:hypothetical protein
MNYRAHAIGRSQNPDLTRALCRWLVRLCRRTQTMAAAKNGWGHATDLQAREMNAVTDRAENSRLAT